MKRPLFQAWCYRPRYSFRCGDLARFRGFAIGFILAPFPDEEQRPGALCSALLHVELTIGHFAGTPHLDWYCHAADRGGPRDR